MKMYAMLLACGIVLSTVPCTQVDAVDFNDTSLANATSTLRESRATTYFDCTLPPNALSEWYYENKHMLVRGCDTDGVSDRARVPDANGSNQWALLNAYRSGGMEGRHWRYITKGDYSYCLKDWTYYGKDGVWVAEHVKGYTTTHGKKKKPWCALAISRPDGKQGYQWEYCACTKKRR